MINLAKLGISVFSGGAVVTGVAFVSGVFNPPVVEKTSLANTAIERPASEIQPPVKIEQATKPEAEKNTQQFPIFHLLTVENAISALIAGNAAPGALVEIMEGDTVLATTTAEENGDFAAVLDQPLSPGEHQLNIRATGKDNTTLMSREFGILRVPEDDKSHALAMVAVASDQTSDAQAAIEIMEFRQDQPKPEEVASLEPAADVSNSSTPAKAVALADQKNEAPVSPQPNVTAKTTAPEVAKEDAKIEDVEIAALPNPVEPKETEIDTEIAQDKPVSKKDATAKPDEDQSTVQNPPEETAPTVMVEAVEVDGSQLFVAGAAEPGRRLAIYIDNEFVGFATGTIEGRFLLETVHQLSPGEHLVRAGVFDSGGLNVAGWAEVPLIHELPNVPVQIAAEPKMADQTDEARMSMETEVARVDVADGQQGDAAMPVASSDVSAKIDDSIAEPKAAEAPLEKPAGKVADLKQMEATVAAQDIEPENQPKPEVALAKIELPIEVQQELPAKDAVAAKEKPDSSVAGMQAEMTVASKVEQPAPGAEEAINVANVKKSEEKPRHVIRTGSAVIIRRGDNLWRISYRTYGRGIQYSTIYQANLRQLRSPHLIYPGQILKVPKKKFGSEG